MSIGNIRSAFIEMWKTITFDAVRAYVAEQILAVTRARAATSAPAATGAQAATSASPTFLGVHLTHVHDEADLRLLSCDPNSRPGLPRRSRSSKVQLNVVMLTCKAKTFDLPQELEALVDKSAPTLATCLERVLLSLLLSLQPPQAAAGPPQAVAGSHRRPEIWLTHCLIGDGIPTNLAAAKILWALSLKGNFGLVRYFLLVGKCGTHQAALTAKNGVIGRAAAAAAEAAGEAKEFEDVTANAVRLFKYLVPE